MTDKKEYKFGRVDYFNMIFRHTLRANEHYTVAYSDKETSKMFNKSYKTIQDIDADIERNKFYNNVFISLATTNGASRAKENLIQRDILAFDFDKKDFDDNFNHKDVLNKFQKLGIYYHMLTDSGNGYHAYVLVEPTTDIDKLVSVNKAIASRLGADMGATIPTQILRVPNTYNYKDTSKPKRCNIIWLQADRSKRIEYSLDRLHKKYVSSLGDSNIRYVPTNKMPPCISEILKGVQQGDRNFGLGRLTKWLQSNNYNKDKALQVVKEWNVKCYPPINDKKIEIDFKNYWEKDYKLLGCISDNTKVQATLSKYCNKYECKKVDKFEKIHLEKTINIEYEIADQIRCRGEKLMLQGNHIAIITILKANGAGLNTRQLEQELTSTITKKCAMSKPTLSKVLNELQELNIIECIESKQRNRSNFYKLIDFKFLENEKFVLSYQAVQRYLDGAIGQSALRVYCYMRYRLSRGDNVVQEEIARDLSLNQKTISKHINELEQARYVIIHTDYSVNSLGANMYEWIL